MKILTVSTVEPGLYVRRGDADPVCMFIGGDRLVLIEGTAADLEHLSVAIHEVAKGIIDTANATPKVAVLAKVRE